MTNETKAGDADRAAACAAAAAHEAFGYCPSLREEARSSAPGEELGGPQGPAAMEALEPVPTTGQERSR